ncbi:flagellar hook-length control protein FliK [Alicyclobacillus sp. SO9]|uniref:flagellar hook-length control protein FliK n=1 Tax=Alicyclobacillus sp. SO9 TaxID=2665646 RepID=UPI0018E6E440|nr:flagellar hook-length control protein FliK [Alicyclobacillus sp. SO9]QQE80808.1 flagellar hook-length control protein FliK [Alicyclobacillus sp. SO9]
MTNSFVLAKDISVQSPGQTITQTAQNRRRGVNPEHAFQQLFDVVASRTSGSGGAHVGTGQATLPGSNPTALFIPVLAKQGAKTASFGKTRLKLVQVSAGSQLHLSQLRVKGFAEVSVKDLQQLLSEKGKLNAGLPGVSSVPDAMKEQVGTQGKSSPGNGSKTPVGSARPHKAATETVLTALHNGQLYGLFLPPLEPVRAVNSQLQGTAQTMPPEGAKAKVGESKTAASPGVGTNASEPMPGRAAGSLAASALIADLTEALNGGGRAKSLVLMQLEPSSSQGTSAVASGSANKVVTSGLGENVVQQGLGLSGLSVKAVQQQTPFTVAGFPVQRVVLMRGYPVNAQRGGQGEKTAANSGVFGRGMGTVVKGQKSNSVTGSKATLQSMALFSNNKAAQLLQGKKRALSGQPGVTGSTIAQAGQPQLPLLASGNVSPSMQTVNIQNAQVYHQFAAMIAQHVQAGSQTLKVQVHPHGLGSITVTVGQQTNGLAIQVSATNPATAAWLQQGSAQLTQALHSAGVNLANLQVDVSQQHPQGQGDGRSGKKSPKAPFSKGGHRNAEDSLQPAPVTSVLDARRSTISLRV